MGALLVAGLVGATVSACGVGQDGAPNLTEPTVTAAAVTTTTEHFSLADVAGWVGNGHDFWGTNDAQ